MRSFAAGLLSTDYPDSMKRSVAAFLLSVFVVASAHAAFPLALGASVALHAFFGFMYSYFVADTGVKNPGGQSVRVTFKVDDSVSAQEIIDEQKRPPAVPATAPPAHGGYSVTVTDATGAYSYTASGQDIGEFTRDAMMCPSHICNVTSVTKASSDNTKLRYLFNLSAPYNLTQQSSTFFSYHYSDTLKAYRARLSLFVPGLDVSNIPTNAIVDIASSVCPPGYAFNTVNGNCDIANIDQVTEASLGDGVCLVYNGAPAVGDVDCDVLAQQNTLTQSSASDGAPTVSVKLPDQTIVTAKSEPARTTISQVKKTPDGGTVREDTAVSRNGTVGPTNSTHYPANPPPLYPGDPGGTPVPGGNVGQSTVAGCGGPGQPVCQVELIPGEGDGEFVDQLGDDLPSSVTDSLFGLTDKALFPVSPACPADAFGFTLPLPAVAGGDMFLSDGGLFCSAMAQYGDLIRLLSIAAAFVSATFIVLRA